MPKNATFFNDFGYRINTMSRYFSYSNRLKADGRIALRIWYLKKNDYLWIGASRAITWVNSHTKKENSIEIKCSELGGRKIIRLIYRVGDEWPGRAMDYMVFLDATPCHFGGKRDWFTCPIIKDGKYCERRVGILYLADGFFACRHCLNLTYDSRNIGGRMKAGGSMVTFPDYEEAKKMIKRYYYNGRKTRKFIRFIKLQNKLARQIGMLPDFGK